MDWFDSVQSLLLTEKYFYKIRKIVDITSSYIYAVLPDVSIYQIKNEMGS